jgi:MFS family permease
MTAVPAGASLNPGVARREVWAWAMYDFANSGYTTVVLTAVFNAYFVSVVAGNADWATFAWTAALSLSYAVVMLIGPPLGAWADAHAAKKGMLAVSTIVCIAGTVALAWCRAGAVAWAVAWIVVSNVAYSMGENLVAAFLPELSRPEALGKVSGWGWSLGYFGGILALALSLAWVMSAQARGSTATDAVPGTMIITAAIYGIAALPTFLWLRERAVPAATPGTRAAMVRLMQTARSARSYVDLLLVFACGVCYQAGVATVIALAAIYAEQVMGLQDPGHHPAGAGGERHRRGGRVRVGLCAGPAGQDGGAARDDRRLDRDERDRLLLDHDGVVLGGREPRGPVHGIEPVGGTGAGRVSLAARAQRRVLRPVGRGGAPRRHPRPAHLRFCDVDHTWQSPPGHPAHRRLLLHLADLPRLRQ